MQNSKKSEKKSELMYGMQLYSQDNKKDTLFNIPSLYVEKCLHIGNTQPPKIDNKSQKF